VFVLAGRIARSAIGVTNVWPVVANVPFVLKALAMAGLFS